ADIVIIIAGIARKPGMTRADLLSINANIVGGIIKAIATHCPKALVEIVTNPVNSLIPAAAAILRQLGAYDEKKLFGVTALDQLRTNTFVAQELGLAPSTLKIPVIGGHSGPTILPLLSQAPGASLSPEAIAQLNDRIKNAGTAVVEAKAGAGSATLSMAQAAATFTQALVKALAGEAQEVCAYVASPDMDIEFFARPVLVGPNGIESFVDYGPLSPQEEEEVQNLKAVLRTDIAEGYDAVAHEG
ncbi:MAG: malate dehydrogenase, partial [Veillonella sp.]|nr:malate dehydrogenase [Veillonella sp.]